MPSSSYTQLRSNVRLLRKHLLPNKFKSSGRYSEGVFTRTGAFRVLSHAAIEDYLEERTSEIAREASIQAKKTGKVCRCSIALIAFSEGVSGKPPASLTATDPSSAKIWDTKIQYTEKIVQSASRFIAHASGHNHGVREENLLALLLPVGFPHKKLDPVLVSELDDFGRERGEFAHSSTSKAVQQNPNPDLELKRVKRLVEWLKDIDEELTEILQEFSDA